MGRRPCTHTASTDTTTVACQAAVHKAHLRPQKPISGWPEASRTRDGRGMNAADQPPPAHHLGDSEFAAPAAARAPGSLAVAIPGRRRAQRALDRAERELVIRVVTDGGIDSWRSRSQRHLEAARRAFARRGTLSLGVAAPLVVALADRPTRDRCWREVESDRDPGWPAFWLHLSRRALPPYRAEPLFLLAWTAWRLGDVPLARAAADATAAEDPGHRGAAMLRAMLRFHLESGRLPSLTDRHGAAAGEP